MGDGFCSTVWTRSKAISCWSRTSANPCSEREAVDRHAPEATRLLAQDREKRPFALHGTLLVQQQRQRPASEGEITATIDLNGDEFLLECPEPRALPDRSETLDRRTLGTHPDGIVGELTEKRRPIARETGFFPAGERALDGSDILCREWSCGAGRRSTPRRQQCRQ